MGLSWTNWITIIGTGLVATAAAALPFIPPPYNAEAAGAIALLGALAHLFMQPSGK